MLSATLKPKTCAYDKCRREFMPGRPMQNVCRPLCAQRYARQQRDEKAAKERANFKARKDAVQTAKELKPAAQDAFNNYIRYRDRHLPCVSCGVENPPMTPGGQWDAGHFLSRGSHPELAFDEDNCHKQCKSCNGGSAFTKHNERTVTARYEVEILRRIGPERLARLKGPNPPAKRTADDYREIRDTYRARLRELKERTPE